jgi:hypothetical protein
MDLNEAMVKHKELWLKISEANIENYRTFPSLKKITIKDKQIRNAQYLCEFSIGNRVSEDCSMCTACPVKDAKTRGCFNGLYAIVRDNFDIETRDKELFKKNSYANS